MAVLKQMLEYRSQDGMTVQSCTLPEIRRFLNSRDDYSATAPPLVPHCVVPVGMGIGI